MFRQFVIGNKQNSLYHIWQNTDHPMALFMNYVIRQKIDYIHQNPVREAVDTDPSFYKCGSACFDSPLKVWNYKYGKVLEHAGVMKEMSLARYKRQRFQATAVAVYYSDTRHLVSTTKFTIIYSSKYPLFV